MIIVIVSAILVVAFICLLAHICKNADIEEDGCFYRSEYEDELRF
jgi:hypothetical protein